MATRPRMAAAPPMYWRLVATGLVTKARTPTWNKIAAINTWTLREWAGLLEKLCCASPFYIYTFFKSFILQKIFTDLHCANENITHTHPGIQWLQIQWSWPVRWDGPLHYERVWLVWHFHERKPQAESKWKYHSEHFFKNYHSNNYYGEACTANFCRIGTLVLQKVLHILNPSHFI